MSRRRFVASAAAALLLTGTLAVAQTQDVTVTLSRSTAEELHAALSDALAVTTTTAAVTTTTAQTTTTATTLPPTTTTTVAATTTTVPVTTTTGVAGIAPQDLQAAVSSGAPGETFWVRPGTANNVSLVLKAGQQVRALDPNNPPIFIGPNSPTNTMRFAVGAGGSASGVVLADLKITGYHPADISWREVAGNTGGFARVPTINGDTLSNARLIRLEMYGNGMAVKLGDGMILEDVYLHHNHYFGLKSNTESGWQILGGEWASNNVHPQGGGFYNDNIGAANKFVGSTDGLVDGLYTHHNEGPGIWFDSGSDNVTIRNVRAEDNGDAGIFWEINNGAVRVEDSVAVRNSGAANIFIANSRGTASDPIVIIGNTTAAHSAGREIRLLGNGNRSPQLGYVSVLNNVTPSIVVTLTNGHPQPVGIVVSGNVNAAGQPVGLK